MIDFLRGFLLAAFVGCAVLWIYCSARCALWVKGWIESYLEPPGYARLLRVVAVEGVVFVVVTYAYLRLQR